jgi:uncharacterized coiled-coil DUF342 family protein
MEPTDLTVEILKGIRDEVHTTNERLDGLRTEVNEGLDGLRTEVNEGLDGLRTEVHTTNERLDGLRTEVHTTNERLDGLRTEVNEGLDGLRTEMHERLGETNERLEGLADEVQGLRADTVQRFDEANDRFGRLERRQTESEVRLSTELVAVVAAVREVRDVLREDLGLRARVEDHERRIAAVETRVG